VIVKNRYLSDQLVTFLFIAMYYRGAAAAILVYDITRMSTFHTLQSWVDELRAKGPKDIALAIAGNKADLEDSRVSSITRLDCC
jgi:GTPase SAR1 family protein